MQQKKQVFPGAKKLLDGNLKDINPQLSMEEQTELIPYDKGWEFPRCRLTLGSVIRFLIHFRSKENL